MTSAYDTTFDLPFPCLPVILRSIGEDRTTPATDALVDSGADITLVPEQALHEIGARGIYTARLRGHWDQQAAVSVYLIDIAVAGHLLPANEVAADHWGQRVLLGRNVLSKLILLLDGPAGKADVSKRRPAHVG